MPKPIRAILIEPVAQTVTAIACSSGLDGLRAELQCQWIDIRSVGHSPDGQPLDIICDDEGRLTEGQRCFRLGGRDGLLIAGRALLTSHDGEGETVSTFMPCDAVGAKLEWLPEGFDYTPPPPTVVGFTSLNMLRFIA